MVAARKHCLDLIWQQHQRGHFSEAFAAYTAHLRQFPRDPVALHYLGVLAHQTGHTERAIELLRESMTIDDRDMRVANHLGQIYARLRRWPEAEQCFAAARALDATAAEPINNLANVMKETGRAAQAQELYREAMALDPELSEPHYNIGKLLRESRAFAQATQAFRNAVSLEPENYRAQYQLGLCLEEGGDFAAAVRCYAAALRANPNHARSMANLLALRQFVPDPAFIERAARIAAAESTDAEAAAKLHQGIGKYLDRAGEYSRAFVHFATSNSIQQRWSKPALQTGSIAKRLTAAQRFDADYFRSVRPLGNPSRRPVFIVGMPRSGTTLIEQVIASHSQAYGAGELMEIPRIAAALSGACPPGIETAAREYLERLACLAPSEAQRVTDKLPINYRHLGVIASLFPNAAVIHCHRDPRDVALSCFIEMFGLADQDFTSLRGIAAAIVEEDRLMRHWRAVLPLPIHEVDYHRFISDQETESRRLLDFCGLSWEPGCLSYFANARCVDTPSRWQVRQPIYTSSDGRWKNYAAELEPAIALLRAAGLLDTPG